MAWNPGSLWRPEKQGAERRVDHGQLSSQRASLSFFHLLSLQALEMAWDPATRGGRSVLHSPSQANGSPNTPTCWLFPAF